MYELIESEPKANQHLHLTGALSLPYIRDGARREGISIAEYEPLETKNFEQPDIWTLAKYLTSTSRGFLDSMKHVVDNQAQDNVELVELTFNPYGMVRRGMSSREIAWAVQLAFEYGRSSGVKLLVRPGVNRKDGPESITYVHDVYQAINEKHRLGIDLNGDERQFSTKPFVSGFRDLAEQGVQTSIHAGEFSDLDESLRWALEAQPKRIGHAVAAIANCDLLSQIHDQNITIEVALTSSLRRGAVGSIYDHPVTTFVDNDIKVVFGTDDPTFFDNTMSNEFQLLSRLGITPPHLRGIMTNDKQGDN